MDVAGTENFVALEFRVIKQFSRSIGTNTLDVYVTDLEKEHR